MMLISKLQQNINTFPKQELRATRAILDKLTIF